MPLLEVEQKFSFTLANALRLSRNTGSPPFKTLGKIHTQTIHDIYYDSFNKLSTAGIWLRRRQTRTYPNLSDNLDFPKWHTHPYRSDNKYFPEWDIPKWEAKQRAAAHGSSFLRSTFSETQDYDEIVELVRAHCGDASVVGPDNDFALEANARIRTDRSWVLADGRFKVVLDGTDFGHWVGEVEVEAEAEDAEKAHGEIEAFLRTYKWFFDTAEPKGKLTTYFEKFGYPKSEG